jgi:hypothetical protein
VTAKYASGGGTDCGRLIPSQPERLGRTVWCSGPLRVGIGSLSVAHAVKPRLPASERLRMVETAPALHEKCLKARHPQGEREPRRGSGVDWWAAMSAE